MNKLHAHRNASESKRHRQRAPQARLLAPFGRAAGRRPRRRVFTRPDHSVPITLLAALLALSGIGCPRPSAPTAAPPNPTAQAAPSNGGKSQAVGSNASRDPQAAVTRGIETLLAGKAGSLLPQGTRLLSADVRDGVASLDFSKEFNGLLEMGDSAESEAQKALRQAVAKVDGVSKMRVTVEGQSFDSQMTDWGTPFPVQDAGGEEAGR